MKKSASTLSDPLTQVIHSCVCNLSGSCPNPMSRPRWGVIQKSLKTRFLAPHVGIHRIRTWKQVPVSQISSKISMWVCYGWRNHTRWRCGARTIPKCSCLKQCCRRGVWWIWSDANAICNDFSCCDWSSLIFWSLWIPRCWRSCCWACRVSMAMGWCKPKLTNKGI